MDFKEAETLFLELKHHYRQGNIDEEKYREGLRHIRVRDDEGKVWAIEESTGRWHCFKQGKWVPETPPHYTPPDLSAKKHTKPSPNVTTTMTQPIPVISQSEPEGEPAEAKLKIEGLSYLIGVVIFWILVGVGILIWGENNPLLVFVLSVIAFITLIMTRLSFSKAWEGKIVDIRTEQGHVEDGPEAWHNETQRMAYIRLPDGKTHKERLQDGWEIGDWLVKQRGDAKIHKG